MQVSKSFKDFEKKVKETKKRKGKIIDHSHLKEEEEKEHGRKVKVTMKWPTKVVFGMGKNNRLLGYTGWKKLRGRNQTTLGLEL